MATRDDVARLAGVSASTVSYAISGRRAISEQTRERVFAAMRQLDYTPNPLARGLAGATKGFLALHYPLREQGMSPMEVRYFVTAAAAAREQGFQLLLWTGSTSEILPLQELISQKLVDGVVLMEVESDDPRIALLKERDVRFVLLGRNADPTGLAYVDTDFETAARTALEHLVDHGHRKVLFVGGAPFDHGGHGHGPTIRTVTELERIAPRYGVSLRLWTGPRAYPSGRHAFIHYAASAADTTAMIIFNDPATIGFVHAAELHGLSIPEDLSVLSIGMGEDAAELDPPISSITPQVTQLTDAAVRILAASVEGRPEEQPQMLLDAQLVDRGSVRSLN